MGHHPQEYRGFINQETLWCFVPKIMGVKCGSKTSASFTILPKMFYWKHLCFLSSVSLEVLVPKGGILFPGATVSPLQSQEMVATRALCTPCAQGCAGEESQINGPPCPEGWAASPQWAREGYARPLVSPLVPPVAPWSRCS